MCFYLASVWVAESTPPALLARRRKWRGRGRPRSNLAKNMTLAIMTVWQCKNENEWQWKLRLMLTTTMKEWGQCWAMQNGNNAKIRNPLEHREHLHLHLLYLPLRICVV